MTRVSVDASCQQAIKNIASEAALGDENGKLIGWFTPGENNEALRLEPTISDEEIQRRLASNERGFTTDEVLAYRKSL